MAVQDRLATLAAIEAELWRQLVRAPHDKHHAWRTPVLATSAGAHAPPEARHVVLREASRDAATMVFFSDARAAKIAQLRAQPQATLAMWSRTLAWQLRVRVACAVETEGPAVAERWARVRLMPSAQDYLSAGAPGDVLDAAPGRADAAAGEPHFAVVTARVLEVDWLELHPLGHRRARFAPGAAEWLQP